MFFSLGTNIPSSFLGPKIKVFLKAIAELKEYNFIWKYEANDLVDIPDNLFIDKWFPQNSILGINRKKAVFRFGLNDFFLICST